MNIAMWALAGGMLGWVGYAVLRVNAEQGMVISIIIGAVGGFFGGNVLAPVFGAITNAPDDFNLFSLLIASASAAGCLVIGNLLAARHDV